MDVPPCELGGGVLGGADLEGVMGVDLDMPRPPGFRHSEGEESSLYPSSPSEPHNLGSPRTSSPLTPLEDIYTPLGGSVERHRVPPTPPPSTEGEDCKSMGSSELEIWKVEKSEMMMEEEEEEARSGLDGDYEREEVEVGESEKRTDREEIRGDHDDEGGDAGSPGPAGEGEEPALRENAGEPGEGDEETASEPPDATAPPSSSSSFVIPELRLDRTFSADALSSPCSVEGEEEEDDEEDEEEDEEEDDEEDDEDEDSEDEEEEEEDDSDDTCLQRSDSKRRSMVEATSATCEKHSAGGGGGACRLSVQNSLRRRTHSEGSLLQEPRTACFNSNNAIHCLEGGGSSDGGGHHKGGGWTLPSPKTLTKNGGSMHQLCMLFSGRKVSASSVSRWREVATRIYHVYRGRSGRWGVGSFTGQFD